MPKWTEYTSKDTLADNDEVMLYDATAKANKRGLMSKFWDYVVDKMSTAVIGKLETENKTVIGALNYLNGKSLINLGNVDVGTDTLKIYSNGTTIKLIVKWENTLHAIVFDANNRLYIQTSTDSGSTWKTIREI